MNRRKNEEKEEQENKERKTSGASHPVCHRERSKNRYTEIEKDKSPEAKGSQDNLRKAGKKQAKLRLGIHN